MTVVVKYVNKYIDYIRLLLNDKDKLIFNDDELVSFIERHTEQQPYTINVTAYSNKYRILMCGCGCGNGEDTAVRDVSLVSGYDDDAIYKIDEMSGTIYFDALDPLNTGTAPVDGAVMSILYWNVCLATLMRELCNVIAQSTTKLATIQSIAGLSINTSKLADQYWKQACIWGSRCPQ